MEGKQIANEVKKDLKVLVDMTEGFSGADVAALVNTAVSMVLQEYVAKYPKPEDAKKHLDEAIVTYLPGGEQEYHGLGVRHPVDQSGELLGLVHRFW